MPIEDPRNLREVGLFLRDLERTIEKNQKDLTKEIDGIKAEIAKNTVKKTQYTLIFLSSIVSPCIILLLSIVIRNSIGT